MKIFILGIGLSILVSGCTSWHSFIEDLNTRQVQSCIWWSGSAAPYITVRGISSTGGEPLDTCIAKQ